MTTMNSQYPAIEEVVKMGRLELIKLCIALLAKVKVYENKID